MTNTPPSDAQKAVAYWLGTGSVNFFGMPFAGKDTQGQRLAARLDAVFISSGDILRHHNMPVPDKLALEHGDMLPVKDYLRFILPVLSQPQLNGKPLVLSAVGHRDGEAAVVLEVLAQSGHPTKAVIHLRIDESVTLDRWRHLALQNDRHREDDKLDILEHRLNEYRAKTIPILDFYHDRKLLLEVDGSGTPDEVETAILESLYEKATQDTRV